MTESPAGAIERVPVDCIRRSPYQPRRDFSSVELDQLAESLIQHGMLQPIVVRPLGPRTYELVAGERRWRAAQRAGWADVPASVRALSDAQAAELALVENLQRQDLGPIELAHAVERLIEQFGLTHEAVAIVLGAERSTVTNWLRLIELDPEVQALVGEAEGQVRAGHAKVLAGVPRADQRRWAQLIIRERLSVRQLEARIARSPVQTDAAAISHAAELERLERALSEHLLALVRIEHGRGGQGRVIVKYASLDELDGLLERIGYRES